MATSKFLNLLLGGGGGGISPVNPSLFPDGTEALPSIAFINNPSMGLYRIGNNNLGISTNGVKRLDLNTTRLLSSLPVYLPDGSAGSPSLTQSSDPDNGIWFGTNVINFSTAGTHRWQIGSAGNLLAAADNSFDIGSATASTRPRNVYVRSNVYAATFRTTNGTTNGGSIRFGNSENMEFGATASGAGSVGFYWADRQSDSATSIGGSYNAINLTTAGSKIFQWMAASVVKASLDVDGTFNALDYTANGSAGVTAGPFTAITSITVVGGIVTALTGT